MKFLVYPKGCLETYLEEESGKACVIEAETLLKAQEIYKNYLIENDEYFLLDCCFGGYNFGLAEKFWLTNPKETDHFMRTGDVLINLDDFKQRVFYFFGSNKNWAQKYLDYHFDDCKEKDIDLAKGLLPSPYPFHEEMLKFIWFGFYNEGFEREYKFSDVSKISKI